ncbi:hypothetical protein JCM24511_01230 [Saitozyma sp. JCM 24511]|nr:hypothetical protein JCM24511_01230 [Saitozyma sp. JCM 24511]
MVHPLTNEQLSNVSGAISIAAWIVVYTPQIWENYQLKSGEGLSVTFIVLWLLGDLTNLFGAVMAKLLPTMIILAVYYTLCDIILLCQVYYYRQYESSLPPPCERHRPHPAPTAAGAAGATETSPLLPPSSPLSLSRSLTSLTHPVPEPHQPKPLLPPYLEYPLLIAFVLAAGVGGWYLTDASDEIGIPEGPGKGDGVELEWKSQVLGYMSAVLYLGSRIPQIIHNYSTRCAGLSLALFFFSITGNITYVLSILLTSVEPRYILANASWLAGSGLTVFLDLIVLAQFAVFSWQDRQSEREDKVFRNDEDEREVI